MFSFRLLFSVSGYRVHVSLNCSDALVDYNVEPKDDGGRSGGDWRLWRSFPLDDFLIVQRCFFPFVWDLPLFRNIFSPIRSLTLASR